MQISASVSEVESRIGKKDIPIIMINSKISEFHISILGKNDEIKNKDIKSFEKEIWDNFILELPSI